MDFRSDFFYFVHLTMSRSGISLHYYIIVGKCGVEVRMFINRTTCSVLLSFLSLSTPPCKKLLLYQVPTKVILSPSRPFIPLPPQQASYRSRIATYNMIPVHSFPQARRNLPSLSYLILPYPLRAYNTTHAPLPKTEKGQMERL